MELTVAELHEMLTQQIEMGNEDLPVHIGYSYGDHWNTQVAPKASDADLLNVERSDYHRMDKLTEDDGEEQTDDSRLVFVIQ